MNDRECTNHVNFRGIAAATTAIGAVAIGAFAIGALVIGRLLIRRVVVESAVFNSLEVRDIKLGRLHVDEIAGSTLPRLS